MIRPLVVATVLVAAVPALAGPSRVPEPGLVRVEEHLGETLPLDAVFRGGDGRPVRLGDLFKDEKPVILVLAYERCPMLCGLVHSSAVQAIKGIDWKIGEQFRAVTVSFDPTETPEAAHRKQATLLSDIGRPGDPGVWPFLTGTEPAIDALTERVGFFTYRDPTSGELAHPAVLTIVTPKGKISRYLYGVDFAARDLKFALLEASEGRSGTTLERIQLTCYRFDPATHRYQLAIAGAMRVFGLVVLIAVGLFVGGLWLRERRRARA
jgi:protein SCO1/2